MRYSVPGICVSLLLLFTHDIFSQCPAPIPLSITKVTTTESRCQASGTAVVQLTGGAAPFNFSITAGPVLVPTQSSNQFQSLSAGSYTVRVTDNCNTSSTANFTITGSYGVPVPTEQLTSPTCPGGNDGKITITVTKGRPSFTYALVNPSPVIVPAQPGNVFTGLPAGSYTYQVTDSCGNFQTRTVTLPDGNIGSFFANRENPKYEGCDSFSIPYAIANNGSVRPPYTITLTLPNGVTQTHVFNSNELRPPNLGYIIIDTFRFRYHHVPGASDPLPFTMSNGCGYTTSANGYLYGLNMVATRILSGCQSLTYTFDQNSDNSPGATNKYHCNTITYNLVSPANVVVATQTNNSTFSGFPPGNNYRVVRQDCCSKDSIYFNWEQRPALQLYVGRSSGYVCKEGTTAVTVSLNNPTQVNIIIASGPPSVTFADGTVHNYTYPDTIKNLSFNNSNATLNYFTAGTYTLIAVDTCGARSTVTLTITPAELRHSTFSTTLKKGCINDNKIIFTAQSSTGLYDGQILVGNRFFNAYHFPLTDSVVNLPPGTYDNYYGYSKQGSPWYYLKGMSTYSCDTLKSTIVIPAYTQPAFAMAPAIAVCNNLRTIALLPDSNSGVSPYRYRISAGATTTPLQNSNIFSGLTAGAYTLQLADACGNSFSNSVIIDTLSVPAVHVAGTVCVGTNTTLSLPVNPYYTYSWQRPNGNIVNGNTLGLTPLTTNDFGNYVVSATSNINGCINTKTHRLVVTNCSITGILPMTLLQFNGNRRGNTVVLQWETAEELNTSHFIVERSTDGIHFNAIQKVMVSGEGTGNYTTADYQPLPGLLYYRLQMVDIDGRFTYSHTLSINNDNNTITVAPRLITDNSEIKVTHAASTQSAVIQITGIDGKVWLTQPVAKGSLQTTINTNWLVKGNYLVVYSGDGARTAVQIVKL